MLFFPNAKINLGLNVVGKRPDGYHNIETVFFPVGLCDALEFIESSTFSLEISGLKIFSGKGENIVEKAYNLVRHDFEIPGLSVHLHKIIPAGAGLGGGSSDGAFMLKMLNYHFQLGLSADQLKTYAGKLGADCPFFIDNTPAFATGTGIQLQPVTLDLSDYHIIIVKPPFSVSTAEAYQTVKPGKSEWHLPDQLKGNKEDWKEIIKNDFETSILTRYPEIKKIKLLLYEMGAAYASLSGSGSAVYGIFPNLPVGLEDLFPEDYFIYR